MESTQHHQPDAQPQKSTFVNVLAWIFIVIGGFSTFIGILQNIMIYKLFPREEMAQAMNQAEQAQQIPPLFAFVFSHFDFIFLLVLLISLTSFVSAFALLKRRNWARLIFIALMAIGITWNVVGVGLQFFWFDSMNEMAAPQGAPPEFQEMMQILQWASVAMAVAFSALLGFIIKKLCSQQIREEFS
jgi:hypothetical protein